MAQQKATTSEAVIEAAAEVFLAKGYPNATLDDIAQQAGISKPTVYRYAKSKQWLMDRIVKRVQSEMTARAEPVWDEGLSVAERLRRLIKVNIESAVEFRPIYEVAMTQHQESSPSAAKQYRQWARTVTEQMASLLEDGMRDGTLALSGDPMVYAQLLQGMLASTYRWYRINDPLSPEELTDCVLELLSAGKGSAVPSGPHGESATARA